MKIIALAGPSGCGKTTIANYILQNTSIVQRFVTTTTRKPRKNEVNHEHYHFITHKEFAELIEQDAFIEYEEVYPGTLYGTEKKELEQAKKTVLFAIDVKGAMSLKELYGEEAYIIYIRPPTIEELEKRLRARGTEEETIIQNRMRRAKMEWALRNSFEHELINDNKQETEEQALQLITKLLT